MHLQNSSSVISPERRIFWSVQYKKLGKYSSQWIKTLWEWVASSPINPDSELGYLSRLLNGVLLIIIALGTLGEITFLVSHGIFKFIDVVIFAAIFLLMLIYALNRRGHYQTAITLTLSLLVFGVYAEIWLGTNVAANKVLDFLVFPILLADFFLSRRAFTVAVILSLAGMIPYFYLPGMADIFVFLVTFSALVGYSKRLRGQMEQTRQRKLQEAEHKYRTLVENVPAITYVNKVNREGSARYVSPQTQTLLGISPEEWIQANGSLRIRLIHPDDIDHAQARFDHLIKTGEPLDLEYRVQSPDGRLVWIQDRAIMLRDDAGNPDSIQGVMHDITERKQAEEKLRRTEELLQVYFSNAPLVVSSLDRHGVLTLSEGAGLKLLGRQPGEAVGQSIFEVNSHLPQVLEAARGALAGQETTALAETDDHIFDVRYVPIRDTNGEVTGAAGVALDITDLKQAEKELQVLNAELEQRVLERTEQLNQMNAELERANQAKDEFLANMSHELRTPLNSILGLSESLLEQRRGSLNEHQQKSLQIVESSGHHLLALINDILDLSKIEAGKFDFYPESFAVDELCRSSLAFIKAQAAKKSITIRYVNKASVQKISADSRRLKQILVNLLSNAVKFTPEHGHVTLHVNTQAEQDLIRFSVIDTGVGIAPEDLQRLFRPFVQLDNGLNRHYEGTGLGLALVHKLTDLHGGSVHVESEVGKGSCFTINLPCECKQDTETEFENLQPQSTSPVSQYGGKIGVPVQVDTQPGVILLAEDNMANILTIGEYVESYGYEVVVAHDGVEAITKAEQVNPGLILMDIQMPGMNGLEAISHLRADPRFAATPIIALTALAMPGDRERCIAAGANEYMSKPVSLKVLLKTINILLGYEDMG
jgi:PAS domain S-box-containing protein